jgi:hypothetical protein
MKNSVRIKRTFQFESMTQSLWMKRILQVRLVQEETAFTRVDQSGCVWALLRQNEYRAALAK